MMFAVAVVYHPLENDYRKSGCEGKVFRIKKYRTIRILMLFNIVELIIAVMKRNPLRVHLCTTKDFLWMVSSDVDTRWSEPVVFFRAMS